MMHEDVTKFDCFTIVDDEIISDLMSSFKQPIIRDSSADFDNSLSPEIRD